MRSYRSISSVLPLLAALATAACGRTSTIARLAPSALNSDVRGSMLLVNAVGSSVWARDALAIRNIAINGDTLRLTVSYQGGCQYHALQPIAEIVSMESYPVQVTARIAHNAGTDPCRSLVTRVLHVDLSPLKEQYRESFHLTTGCVALRLAGTKEVPLYEF